MGNLVEKSIKAGGSIHPLIIDSGFTGRSGLMNPSIFIDDDGDILCILRHVNYTLYHSENKQMFPSAWGPLAYLHPEHDRKLKTTNFLCRLDSNLNITNYTQIDTSKLDVTPLWEFVGEEDCRLVKWDGKYYAIGVRRDTTTNGQGRMELSEIELNKKSWTAKEVSRIRIPSPVNQDSYCEKNWVPIIHKPYHFVKWTSPTEIVRTYPELPARCEQVEHKPGAVTNSDQRGGSHVVQWKDHYLSITHEVNLFNNYLKQKDGIYRHRLCIWNKDMTLIGISPNNFSFMDGRIEFCSGAAVLDDSLLVSFGFQDNAAYVLKIPENIVDKMISEALNNDNI